MATKPIDRLLFEQGGRCFFCQENLPTSEASIEHLVAKTNGGNNEHDNTVACCKSLNALLGRMSVKEKLRVVLNQKGPFQCPNGASRAKESTPPFPHKFERVVADLRKRGTALPATIRALKSTMNNLFQKKLTAAEQTALVEELKAKGVVVQDETKVSYCLPAGDV
jgi:hypothetical protein